MLPRKIASMLVVLTSSVSACSADRVTSAAPVPPSAERQQSPVVALNKSADTIFVGDTVRYTVSGSAVAPGTAYIWKADTATLAVSPLGMNVDATTVTVVGRRAGTRAWVGVIPQVKPYPYAAVAVVVRDRPASDAAAPVKPAGPQGTWRLTFADEFSGAVLDTTRWHTEYPWGRTKGPELQYHAPDEVAVSDGALHLTAHRRAMEGKTYTAGMIASWGKFTATPGTVLEMRAKVPAGTGMWPAFWLLPPGGVWPPELDVVEVLGRDPTTAYMTAHWGTSDADHQSSAYVTKGADLSAGYHTYTMQWDSTAVIWYLDGVETGRFTNAAAIPRGPMYVLANLAVGGNNWVGWPDATTPNSTSYDIDYIRAWRRP